MSNFSRSWTAPHHLATEQGAAGLAASGVAEEIAVAGSLACTADLMREDCVKMWCTEIISPCFDAVQEKGGA